MVKKQKQKKPKQNDDVVHTKWTQTTLNDLNKNRKLLLEKVANDKKL